MTERVKNPLTGRFIQKYGKLYKKLLKIVKSGGNIGDTGTSIVHGVEDVVGAVVPEFGDALDVVNKGADVLLSVLPNHLLPSAQFREKYFPNSLPSGEVYESLIQQYGADSDVVSQFKQLYPDVLTDNMILYNADDSLRYPLPIQMLYIAAQKLGVQNYKQNFMNLAKMYNVNTSDPSFTQTFRNIHFDHISLSQNGHY